MLPKRQKLRRVLAIHLGKRHDLILIIPALQKLRQLLPNAAITLMVSPNTKQLGLQIRCADNLLVYEGADYKFRNAECELALISKLCRYDFDASLIFTNPGESPYSLAYICYLAGIPIRIGQSQEFGGSVLSKCVKPQPLESQFFQALTIINELFEYS